MWNMPVEPLPCVRRTVKVRPVHVAVALPAAVQKGEFQVPSTPATGAARSASPISPRRMLLWLGTLAAAAGLAVAAHSATATSYDFCQGAVISPGGHCDGPRHSLTASEAHDDAGSDRVCAGATDVNGSFVGSYVCANNFAKHCYSGADLLYPRIHNGETGFAQQMHGTGFYSQTCP